MVKILAIGFFLRNISNAVSMSSFTDKRLAIFLYPAAWMQI